MINVLTDDARSRSIKKRITTIAAMPANEPTTIPAIDDDESLLGGDDDRGGGGGGGASLDPFTTSKSISGLLTPKTEPTTSKTWP